MATIPPTEMFDADYAWEVATLFPAQGYWSEDAYLDLTDGTNRRVELVDGRLEFLPMPTELHQALVEFLFDALRAFVKKHDLGFVPMPTLRVRVPGSRPRANYREPDVLFIRKENYHLRSNRIWKGADLLMEIVSGDPKDRKRDFEDKLIDYAATGVAEYWIIDPQERRVILHRLDGQHYTIHAEFQTGQQATSVLLPGFSIDVTDLFRVADTVAEDTP
jgi:Uma2 family endonuclease